MHKEIVWKWAKKLMFQEMHKDLKGYGFHELNQNAIFDFISYMDRCLADKNENKDEQDRIRY